MCAWSSSNNQSKSFCTSTSESTYSCKGAGLDGETAMLLLKLVISSGYSLGNNRNAGDTGWQL